MSDMPSHCGRTAPHEAHWMCLGSPRTVAEPPGQPATPVTPAVPHFDQHFRALAQEVRLLRMALGDLHVTLGRVAAGVERIAKKSG